MAEIYDAVIAQREAIERGELEMLRKLTASWVPGMRWLQKRFRDLTEYIFEEHEAGRGVSISYVYAQERYRTMMEEAEKAVEQYNLAAAGIISGAEADAVDLRPPQSQEKGGKKNENGEIVVA